MSTSAVASQAATTTPVAAAPPTVAVAAAAPPTVAVAAAATPIARPRRRIDPVRVSATCTLLRLPFRDAVARGAHLDFRVVRITAPAAAADAGTGGTDRAAPSLAPPGDYFCAVDVARALRYRRPKDQHRNFVRADGAFRTPAYAHTLLAGGLPRDVRDADATLTGNTVPSAGLRCYTAAGLRAALRITQHSEPAKRFIDVFCARHALLRAAVAPPADAPLSAALLGRARRSHASEWLGAIERAAHHFPGAVRERAVHCPAAVGVGAGEPAVTYRIDMYFPAQRVAVECDEHSHAGAAYAGDARRTARIERVLNAAVDADGEARAPLRWVRFDPHDAAAASREHVIGDVLHALHGSGA
jgi:hypothetical protein